MTKILLNYNLKLHNLVTPYYKKLKLGQLSYSLAKPSANKNESGFTMPDFGNRPIFNPF